MRLLILLPFLLLAVACSSHHRGSATGLSATAETEDEVSTTLGIGRRLAELAAHEAETRELTVTDAPVATVASEPWTFGDAEGRLLLTTHYQIHTTLLSANVLDMLPGFMETAIAHYTTTLGALPEPSRRMNTFLFDRRRQWEDKTRELLPRQAETYLKLGRGGYSTRGTAVLYHIDRYGYRDTLAITAHEGWHQYTQTVFQEQLPIWLEEGIATYMEGFQRSRRSGDVHFEPWLNTERYYALRNAARNNRLIPFRELLERSPQSFLDKGREQLLTYYAQVWALTHFIVEGEQGRYREALHEALLDAAHGRMVDRIVERTNLSPDRRRAVAAANRTGPWLVQAYFTGPQGSNLDAFEAAYLDFVKTITADGSRPAIHRGRSPMTDED